MSDEWWEAKEKRPRAWDKKMRAAREKMLAAFSANNLFWQWCGISVGEQLRMVRCPVWHPLRAREDKYAALPTPKKIFTLHFLHLSSLSESYDEIEKLHIAQKKCGPQKNVPGPGTFLCGPLFFKSGPHRKKSEPLFSKSGPLFQQNNLFWSPAAFLFSFLSPLAKVAFFKSTFRGAFVLLPNAVRIWFSVNHISTFLIGKSLII